MIVNVNVVNQLGDKFGNLPKGAGVGPYEPVSFAPNEAVVLHSKKDYWGGPVCVDALRFIALGAAASAYDSFKTGAANVVFLRDPVTEAKAQADKTLLYANSQNIGAEVEINQRPNAPGSDPRVRQAIALALDPKVYDQRVYGGVGQPTSAIIGPKSRWFQGLRGPESDPDRAKQLVQQILAEGKWDGTLKLVAGAQPPQPDAALTIEAELKAVGFKINKNLVPNITIPRLAGDFDVLLTGVNVSDASPYVGLTQFTTTGHNSSHYSNPQFDAAVGHLKAATTDAATKAVLKNIQDIWNQTNPGAVLGALDESIIWNPTVKGLVFSEETLVLFNKAYLAK